MSALNRGRPKGARGKATKAREAIIASAVLTPLEYMLSVFRDENNPPGMRMEAAKAAAPYVHPKLAQTEIKAEIEATVKDYTDMEAARSIAFALHSALMHEAPSASQ